MAVGGWCGLNGARILRQGATGVLELYRAVVNVKFCFEHAVDVLQDAVAFRGRNILYQDVAT